MVQKQDDQYDKIIKREKELKEKKKEAQLSNTTQKSTLLNYKTYITGLLKGQITDIEYITDSILSLTVRTIEGDIKVKVNDSGGYSEDNELVRLLEWKDIPDVEVGELLGRNITLKSSELILDRSTDIDDIEFDVYVPQKLDTVGKSYFYIDAIFRRLGLTQTEDIIDKNSDPILKFLLGWLFLCYVMVTFCISVVICLPLYMMMGDIATILPIFMTIFTGIELRIVKDAYRKYKEYRKKDTIQNSAFD
jgi:hypothetical protein